jgi:cardiolipin synthase A/B
LTLRAALGAILPTSREDTNWRTVLLLAVLSAVLAVPWLAQAGKATQKQKSLDEWRALTASNAAPPRVFVKGNEVRFFFPSYAGVEAFSASWKHDRVPAAGYRVHSAILRWNQRLSKMPEGQKGWREATVISGAEWRNLSGSLLGNLAPSQAMHGAYYQTFLADGLVYRDAHGAPRFVASPQEPKEVTVDHRYSVEETLEVLSLNLNEQLARKHAGANLFLLMAPGDAGECVQPLLLDREKRRCVYLSPSVLYDYTERGLTVQATAQSLGSLVFESHGLALLKNPVSSAFRLGDLGIQTLVRFLRWPLPRGKGYAPVKEKPGMDLAKWEQWLDQYTGTRRESGKLRLLIDGDQFFNRLHDQFAAATNYIHASVYIFDRDDIAVGIADQLKQRAQEIKVKVVMDRMGSLAGAFNPPATPLPEAFEMPSSITKYLAGSKVQVRLNLNPWFSADHSKVIVVDGNRAWIGGMNFGREYRYEWHDMMVEIEGPVVASFEAEFEHGWAHASSLGDLAYAARLVSGGAAPEPTGAKGGGFIDLRRLPTKTLWKPFSAAVQGALRRAQSCVYVENPYLFDKRVIAGLVVARQRGVDVRVIFPRVNDFKAGARSNLVMANYLLQHGVRVYFYPAMTHVKAVLIDGWACVGSANLNHLSLRLNQEQNIATSDASFVSTLKRDLFEADLSRSYELTEPVAVDWVDIFSDLVLESF